MNYTWGKYVYKVPAKVVGEKIEEIIDSGDELNKFTFLDASRPEDSSTHCLFEWDDDKAAELYRLHQSSNIIRNLHIEVSNVDSDEIRITPAYINVERNNAKNYASYRRIDVALSDSGMRNIVLENAKRDMRIFRNKYGSLKELSKVIYEINELLEG